jgi:OmpA-OmpF porin, OOP family
MQPRKLLLSGIVGAAMMALSPAALSQTTGFYVGGAIGQTTIDACGVVPAGLSCDDEDTSWKILGGYQINRNFSAELGYSNLGEITASGPGGSLSIESNAWELVGVGSYPLSNQLSVYGKLGLYRAEVELTSTVGISGDETATDLTYGVGLRYDFTPTIGVRGEWQRYGDVGGGSTGEGDVDVLSVGVIFKF